MALFCMYLHRRQFHSLSNHSSRNIKDKGKKLNNLNWAKNICNYTNVKMPWDILHHTQSQNTRNAWCIIARLYVVRLIDVIVYHCIGSNSLHAACTKTTTHAVINFTAPKYINYLVLVCIFCIPKNQSYVCQRISKLVWIITLNVVR
jgi:hypothetical protein